MIKRNKLYIIILSIFFISFSSGFNFENANIISNLDDVNTINALDMQTLLFNYTSKLWYNAYLNDSSHSVNNSILWDGNAYGDEGHWEINGTDIYYNDGNVGIGTSNPEELFHVNGNSRIDGTLDMNDNIYMNNNNILMQQGNIFDANNFTMTGYLNITSNQVEAEQSQLNIINTNPFGFSGARLINSDGDDAFWGLFSKDLAQLVYPDIVGENQSISGLASNGGPLFISTTENNSLYLGGASGPLVLNPKWVVQIEPLTESFILQGNKRFIPKTTNGGNTLWRYSEDQNIAGGVPHCNAALKPNGEFYITDCQHVARNNSGSIRVNSQMDVPDSYIQYKINDSNFSILDTDSNTSFVLEITDYLEMCDYLQNVLGLIPEGCQLFFDTTNDLVPNRATGRLEVWRDAIIHEGLLVYDDFDFVDRDNSDFNLLWTNINNGGKLHVRDSRTIEANITEFDQVIATFDSTLSPFASESISPEPGRDWRITLLNPSECFNDECATANGGNDKIMSFSASTTFSGGTVASSNSRLLFYITTSFPGGGLFTVTMDNNEGSVQTVYTETLTSSLSLVNVSFPATMENKSNVTTRFILSTGGSTKQVWIDQVRVTSEPASPIVINESYDGGKITVGTDIGLDECYIEKDKFVNNATQDTENRLNLKCDNINFIGNVTETEVTIVDQNITGNQTITGDSTIGGNLTVGGNITGTYFFGDGSQLIGLEGFNYWNKTGNDIYYNIGNVGIGTSIPQSRLDVNGSINLSSTDTNQLILPLGGTQSSPTIAFGDGDTGFYQSPDDQIQVTINNLRMWAYSGFLFQSTVTGGGALKRSGRSTTAPTHTFTGDNGAGMGNPEVGEVNLIANSAEVVRISSDGKVGIGEIDPTHKLYVNGSTQIGSAFSYTPNDALRLDLAVGNPTGDSRFLFGQSNSYFGGMLWNYDATPANAYLTITADGSEGSTILDQITLLQNGNVGIGTSSPQNALDVSGCLNVGSTYAGVNTCPTDGGLIEGRLGINTTNPLSILHINGGVGSLLTGLAFGDGDTGFYEIADDAIGLSNAGTLAYRFGGSTFIIGPNSNYASIYPSRIATDILPNIVPADIDGNTGIGRAGVDTLSLVAGGVNGLNINETGSVARVGIGTTRPSQELEVSGNANITNNIYVGGFISMSGNNMTLGYGTNIYANSTGCLILQSADTGGGRTEIDLCPN
jgi:hypothetical protein